MSIALTGTGKGRGGIDLVWRGIYCDIEVSVSGREM